MSSLVGDLVFLIMQFLDEEKFKETLHMLERESGIYFSITHFEDEVMKGNWDAVERYLSGFTKIGDSPKSTEIFFEIRKQKYLEALDGCDGSIALGILNKDLKVFSTHGEGERFKELAQLLTHENFRYGDTRMERASLAVKLKKLIEADPLLRDKLHLNWQHKLCKYPRTNPDIKTLFADHECGQPDDSLASVQESNPQLADNLNIQPAPTPDITHSGISGGANEINASINPAAILTHPRISPATNPAVEYPSSDFDERKPIDISNQNHSQPTYGPNELPKAVARILDQGSTAMSMDFHPILKALLLVGTNVGDIGLWDAGFGRRLVNRNFKSALVKDLGVSVNRVTWSPDGHLFGVAFSRQIAQLYSYYGAGAIYQKIELDAHVGDVNDLAFAQPDKKLLVITCGDDKTIKVWDATSGAKQRIFGHGAAVFSVCPHYKENTQIFFSTALDGRIKIWSYDNEISCRHDYDVSFGWCTTMVSSTDGSRLFLSGTYSEGGSFVVEWNENGGLLKRTYRGFHRRRPLGVVQFDTTRNRFLAVGDESVIKFWDMDNVDILTVTDAEGDLPVCPRIRFNKDGTFLAVSAHENAIKILANAEGLSLLRTYKDPSFDVFANPEDTNTMDDRPTIIENASQCRSMRLMDDSRTSKISRLIYFNSGAAIVALASNVIHSVWRWPCNERNSTGKATTSIAPQSWQPPNGTLMSNDVTSTSTSTNPEEAISCFAVSRNDSYVISASGGIISVYNMNNFKIMVTFNSPPAAAATFLALNPQDNNMIAIGMDDSTIQIYYTRTHEAMSTLRGHLKRITGLAFSPTLNVLVSAGADERICVWNVDGWEQERNTLLHIPSGHTVSGPTVQFHQDQIHFLAVHERGISIYQATDLEWCKHKIPPEGTPPISDATFSCDGRLVYIIFLDASVRIISAGELTLLCRISPDAYLPAEVSPNINPTVIAAHPLEPYQFAVGLTDGSIHVLEPAESEGKWGITAQPVESESASMTSSGFSSD